jgi:hypothetical protein
MKHNAEIVLEALYAGMEVELDDLKLILTTENELAIKGTKENTVKKTKEEVLLPIDASLTWFLNACDKMPDEVFAAICMNLALRK